MTSGVPPWAAQMVALGPDDDALPSGFPGVNVVLSRARLAKFLADFSEDADLRDLLFLDIVAAATGAEVSSTGMVEEMGGLAIRPFRLWEYVWLFKILGLSVGGFSVLDLGGPASHIVLLSACAENKVLSLDINPQIVDAGRQCAQSLGLETLEVRVADMRDLAEIPNDGFDRIICTSVLEHLAATDQEQALAEMARVLRPGGIIGLTFDYGPPAPGANEHLPPPHEPPQTPEEVQRRYIRNGLVVCGNAPSEAPIPGGLFRDEVVTYVIASLFLGKPPLPSFRVPSVKRRRASALSSLRIPDLPYRTFRTAVSTDRRQLRQTHASQPSIPHPYP